MILILSGLLLALAGSVWIGQSWRPDHRPWTVAGHQWEELELRRLLEVYRFRHGSYPKDLTALVDERLPVSESTADRWSYAPTPDAYTLTMK
jgi:hypothetical protein